jgi:hypothetical protein
MTGRQKAGKRLRNHSAVEGEPSGPRGVQPITFW